MGVVKGGIWGDSCWQVHPNCCWTLMVNYVGMPAVGAGMAADMLRQLPAALIKGILGNGHQLFRGLS